MKTIYILTLLLMLFLFISCDSGNINKKDHQNYSPIYMVSYVGIDVEKNEAIKIQNIVSKQVTKQVFDASTNAIAIDDIHHFDGKRVNKSIKAGEYLKYSHFDQNN